MSVETCLYMKNAKKCSLIFEVRDFASFSTCLVYFVKFIIVKYDNYFWYNLNVPVVLLHQVGIIYTCAKVSLVVSYSYLPLLLTDRLKFGKVSIRCLFSCPPSHPPTPSTP